MRTDPGFPSPALRRELLGSALRFVAGSRRLIRRKGSGAFSVRQKADRSLVTEVDLAAERFLRSAIHRRFPGHGVIGEEFGALNPSAEFQWILDPIDGTFSFTRGIPLFGTILALHFRARPVLGVIDHPALGLCFSAAAGLGARCNGRRLRVGDLGPGRAVEGEIIAAGDRAHFIKCGREMDFDRLIRRHPQVRSYSDCFGHTMAASGSVGAMVDFGVRLWDVAATQVLIEEAGGKYVLAEKFEKPGHGIFYGIICGKPRVVDWLTPLFKKRPPSRASAK